MSNKIFVGGLSFDSTDESLKTACRKYGEITEAVVVMDRETGRSRGFGFVTFTDEKAARDAIAGLNNTDLDGRTIRVDSANARPERGERREPRY